MTDCDGVEPITGVEGAALYSEIMAAKGRSQPGTPVDICTSCGGTGIDYTWHEGATAAEVHPCGYCQGGTYSGQPAVSADASSPS